MSDNENKKSGGGFLKFLGVIFLIVLIIGGTVFIGKCAYKKYGDSNANTDGNPILLTRAAAYNDISVEQTVKATILFGKDTYVIVPNVDIKNLRVMLEFYDSSQSLIYTDTHTLGDVVKSQSYTITVSHSYSAINRISKYSYKVTGGSVSYFSK